MKSGQKLILVLILMLIILTGCLYPKSELAKNQIPNEQQLEMIQQAVKQYKEDTGGLVPIKTKESDAEIYEKYLIDFTELKEAQLISEIPGTAYENGGVYQYVIDRKSTRLNSSHVAISYAVFCLKKKKKYQSPNSV